MTSPERELMSAAQAAKLLKVSKQSVCEWVKRGKLTPLGKIDGRQGALVFDASYIREIAKAA